MLGRLVEDELRDTLDGRIALEEKHRLAESIKTLDETRRTIEHAMNHAMTDQEIYDAVALMYKLRGDLAIVAGIIQRRV